MKTENLVIVMLLITIVIQASGNMVMLNSYTYPKLSEDIWLGSVHSDYEIYLNLTERDVPQHVSFFDENMNLLEYEPVRDENNFIIKGSWWVTVPELSTSKNTTIYAIWDDSVMPIVSERGE